ncbi:putative chaperone protein DnaJ [Candidatus Nitrososphaera gargensis Ga9.2]|uniref:Putative chaperone protein DnaJ n=1 Tax=Nitrososphaera gargensis (strain Ga9.2) TaxID=1237085 RepID=K0IME3_NITGG|nr:J domain-containing protein [Candidatus Nitrososphaera gargensis]AFU60192.1 putative chaperone protein DnaJ [Candidatus Nitrososphaera gargensis Ga9.2]
MNYYAVLGISPDATADEVRQAYFRLAKLYHPDRNKSPEATEKMAEINLAYETLRDEHRRKEYDLENRITINSKERFTVQYEDEEEIGRQPGPFGKCVRCNFVNNSGVFVCSTCGNVFDPHAKHEDKERDEEYEEKTTEDVLSEIIRCPQCNEVNTYSRGSCWQCGLVFGIDEIAE